MADEVDRPLDREENKLIRSSPDIFVFCLSTRAGGLGINLTAADTVIFCKSLKAKDFGDTS